MQIRSLLSLVILLCPAHAWLQSDQYKIETVSLPEIGQRIIVDEMVQDESGVLWIATADGLVRYDGHRTIKFLHDPEDPTSISGNDLSALYFDSFEHLWVGGYDGIGLNRMNLKTGEFAHFLPEESIWCLMGDSQGKIWIGTISSGLYQLDPKTDSIRHFPTLPSQFVHVVLEDHKGQIWVGAGRQDEGGLYRYLPESQSFLHYPPELLIPSKSSIGYVSTLLEDSQYNLWVGTAGGKIFKVSHNANQLEQFLLENPWNDTSWVSQIYEDLNKKVWFVTLNGLFHFDVKTGRQTHFGTQSPINKTPTNVGWTICQTQDSILWIGTGRKGGVLFKLFHDPPDLIRHELMGLPIYSLIDWKANDTRQVWAGSSDGLFSYDLDQRLLKHFPLSLEKITGPGESIIHSLCHDAHGNLWAALLTRDAKSIHGLLKFNTKQAAYSLYPLPLIETSDFNRAQGQFFNPIMEVIIDKAGIIWLATHGYGLFTFDPENLEFHKIYPDSLNRFNIVDLFEDPSGVVWILGYQKGEGQPSGYGLKFLDRFEPHNRKLSHIKLFEKINRRTTRAFEKIIEVGTDGIWLQGGDEGLINLDREGNLIETVNYANSDLPQSEIMTCIFDSGQLWIKGPKEIFRFDLTKKNITSRIIEYYDSSQKIDQFNFNGGVILSDGTLIFGSQNGVLELDPSTSIKFETSKVSFPTLVVTERQADASTFQNRFLNGSQSIKLTHNENVFSIHFFMPDFRDPESNSYVFRMQNYDREWNHAQTPVAQYFNLQPGDYQFSVRARGYQNSVKAEAVLQITILPPWYWAWWSKSIYLLAITLLIYWIYQYQLKRQLAIAEANRLKELDTFKSRLYTNITHEFRTPLTIILGLADQLQEKVIESGRESLQMLKRNGNRLLNLVNQMLDLQKLEAGAMPLHLTQGDIVLYLKYLVESFYSYATSKNIDLQFSANPESIIMDYDPEKIQDIVSNLVSNAIKFTPKNGLVQIDCSLEKNNLVKLFVRDNGTGISPEKLPHIFERFYQADDSSVRHTEGSGVGLALTKELVELMGGQIAVNSILGAGSEFTMTLPVSNQASMADRKIANTPLVALSEDDQLETEKIEPSIGTDLPNVLLIEDNHDVVKYIQSILVGRYQIVTSQDGLEGVGNALESIPDLIISDVMMPKMDGYQVCQILKQDRKTSHIPIILLTAKADIESKLEGLQYGADAYLNKPFNKEELLVQIKSLLDQRSRLQNHYQFLYGIGIEESKVNEVSSVPKMETKFIQNVRAIINDHLDDTTFGVDQLCQKMAMSNSQLYRKLKAQIGISAHELIQSVRLSNAKSLLTKTENSIAEIAYECGFSDPEYFSRVFRKEFNTSPSEFRNT